MKKRVSRSLAAVLCLVMALSLFTPALAAEPAADAGWTHDFTASGKTSSFYTITGNLSTSKGTVNYDGKTLTQCLKLEGETSITFTAPTDGTLTLVFGDAAGNAKVDGTKYTASNNVATVDVAKGAHTITKADSHNLFYMVYASKAAGPHDPVWDEGEVTKEPTCTEPGEKTYHCTVSGCADATHVKTEKVATIAHTYENNGVYCTVCGRNMNDPNDVHTEHTYGEWSIDQEASCTEAGNRHRTCTYSGCNKTVTETIPVTDHTYNNQGVCSVCGATKSVAAGGWFEAMYAEMADVKPTDVTGVSWTGADEGSLSATDRQYLVRAAKVKKDGAEVDGVRIDVPGLKAGAYDLTITTGSSSVTAKNITVLAHDRSGYAHWKYTDGVGAYKDDGTLKANAVVLYVTEENKESVTLTVDSTTVKGIGNILNSAGKADNGNNDILKKLAGAGKPLVVRIIGNVTAPKGVTAKASSSFGGDAKDNGSMARMKDARNVTIEGIGTDATVNGWGFHFMANSEGYGKSFEVRNITFRNVPEDCVGMEGQQSGTTLTVPVERCWIHNCEFYVPKIANPAEDDKAEGDGACDFKRGQYMTMDYCYYEGYHKTNLIGANDDNIQYHITWHHNYYKDCESRGPLARQADIHIYNTIYDHQTSYCQNPRANAYIFSEYNRFINECAAPGRVTGGGVIKSYNDFFESIKKDSDQQATVVTDKNKTVPSENKYANFDTNSSVSYIPGGNNYKLDTTAEAMTANIKAYTGTMKPSAGITTPDVPDPGPTTHTHSWGEWTKVKDPTCTEAGERKRTCGNSDCTVPGGVQTETIPAPGHDWGEWVVTPATCTENGSERRVCGRENCPVGAETRTIAAPGHDWGEWVVTPATCTEDGSERRVCGRENCPVGVETRTITAPGHDWGEWSVTKDPDCIHDGEETRECATCHETETRAVDATGEHVYGDDGNCTTPGCTANNGKPALKAAIAAARDELDAAQVSTDAAFVLKSENWVTEAVKNAYRTAIQKAQDVADKTGLTEKEVQDAITALSTATTTFRQAAKPGAAAQRGTLGQLLWGVDAAGNLKLSGTGASGETVIAASWDSGSGFLGAKLLTGSQTTLQLGSAAKVKLLWLDGRCAPKCEAATITK